MPLKSTANRAAEAPTPFAPGLFKSRNNETIWLITTNTPSVILPGMPPSAGYIGVLVSGQAGSGYPLGHLNTSIDLKIFEPFYGSITLEQTR